MRVMGLFLTLLLLGGCVTYNLEKALDPDIREWYDLHHILMETNAPEWIETPIVMERIHFLRLPKAMQQAYINVFWRMRKDNAEWAFYSRVEGADIYFRDEGIAGHKTDRGRIFLIHGTPDHMRFLNRDGYSLVGGWSNIDAVKQIWYYHFRGYVAVYIFHKRGNSWRQSLNLDNNRHAEEESLKRFAPTDEGWELWGSILHDSLNKAQGRPDQ